MPGSCCDAPQTPDTGAAPHSSLQVARLSRIVQGVRHQESGSLFSAVLFFLRPTKAALQFLNLTLLCGQGLASGRFASPFGTKFTDPVLHGGFTDTHGIAGSFHCVSLVDHQLGCLQTEFRTEVSSFRHRLHLIHYVSDHTLKIRWPDPLCHYTVSAWEKFDPLDLTCKNVHKYPACTLFT